MAKSLISSAQAPVDESNSAPPDKNLEAGNVMFSDSPDRNNAKPIDGMKDDLDGDKKKVDEDKKKVDEDKEVADKAAKEEAAKALLTKFNEKMGEGGLTKEKWDALTEDEKKEFSDALNDDQKQQLGIEEKKPDEKKGAPEKYEDFKLPEGVVVLPEMMEKTQKVFKELNLSQEQAQALIDLNIENARAVAEAGEQTAYSKFNETREAWVNQIRNDPDVGRGKFDESQAHVAKARKFFAGKDEAALIEALDVTGAGDNPAMYKFLVAVGRSIKNDKFVDPSESGKGEDRRSAESIMYS